MGDESRLRFILRVLYFEKLPVFKIQTHAALTIDPAIFVPTLWHELVGSSCRVGNSVDDHVSSSKHDARPSCIDVKCCFPYPKTYPFT